ncbi:Cna B-type domain-containing protein [Lapidilactobacillus salsurivasis]
MFKKIWQRTGRIIALTILTTATLCGSGGLGSGLAAQAAVNDDVPNGGSFYADVPEAKTAPLKAAQFFHIFSNEAITGAHTNGNIATDELFSETNFGTNVIDGSLVKDIYYFQDVHKISSSAFVSSDMARNKAVFGEDTEIELASASDQNAISVNQNKLDHLQEDEVYQDKDQQQYLNIKTELADDLIRSNTWGQAQNSTDVHYDNSNENNRVITITPSVNDEQIVLTKKDQAGRPLAKAVFSLYRNGATKPQVTGLTTDENGQIRVSVAQAGLYYFIETQAPAGYELDPDRHFVAVDPSNSGSQAYHFYNLNASELELDRPLTVKGLSRTGGPLVINVHVGNQATLDIRSQIKLVIDGADRLNHETEDFSDAKILWNFVDANGTKIGVQAPFQGTMLAPQAEITAHQNIDGSLIADLVNVKSGETHRWDFQGDASTNTPATVTVVNEVQDNDPDQINVSGNKVWEDQNDQDGLRPTYLTVFLWRQHQNGVKELVTQKIVTASGAWHYEFADLPTHDQQGRPWIYSVSEEKIPGYTTTVCDDDLINQHTPAVTAIEIKKIWDDAANSSQRPNAITAHLWRHGNNGIEKVADFELTATNHWQKQFNDLPKYDQGIKIHYFVTEDDLADYSTEINGFNLTNHLDLNDPDTTNVFGAKVWHDQDNIYGNRPNNITVTLERAWETGADGEPVWQFVASKVVDAQTNWEYFFNDLPKFSENGQEINYRVTEATPDGYTVTQDGHNLINTADPELGEQGTAFINLRLRKFWNDQQNQTGQRPTSIKVQLYANDQALGAPKTLSANQNWVGLWLALPKYNEQGKEINYTVKEVVPKGYSASYDQLPLTEDGQLQEINLIDTLNATTKPKQPGQSAAQKETKDQSTSKNQNRLPQNDEHSTNFMAVLGGTCLILTLAGLSLDALKHRRRN